MTDSRWWRLREHKPLLDRVLAHLNEARVESSPTQRTKYLFDSLNVLWSGLRAAEGEPGRGDMSSFTRLVRTVHDDLDLLLASAEYNRVVSLEPCILNHHTLNKAGYMGGEISEHLQRSASEEHRELRTAAAQAGVDKQVRALTDLLYAVRSNIAHGEKTPYGPDFEKAQRDEEVCRVVAPVLGLIVDLVLGQPSCKLAAYGTLVPGGPNEGQIRVLNGEWTVAELFGDIFESGGYRYFSEQLDGRTVPCMVLSSAALHSEWDRLDRFEGRTYRRVLVPVLLHGELVVVNVYSATSRGDAAERLPYSSDY